MTFNIWTFLFEVVNFVVLAYILHRLLYRPLRAAVDARRAEIEKEQADAEAARSAALEKEHELEAQLAELENKRQELIREARAAADAERARLVAEADAAIARRQEEARGAIEHQREDALRSLGDEVRAAAAQLAGRLLAEAADANLERQLVKRLVGSLGLVSADERAHVRRDWNARDGAVLEAPAALDAAATREIAAAVESLVGQEVKLRVEIKPALVAGVRLRIGGHVWDASLAGQLEPLVSSATQGAGRQGTARQGTGQ